MADPQDAGATQSAVEQATPLHNPPPQPAALQADVRALVGYLLDQKPENGDTPLMAALGNPHVARLLLEHGADPNAARADDGMHCAVTAAHGHSTQPALLWRRGDGCCLTATQTPTQQRPTTGLLRCTSHPKKATWTSHGCCLDHNADPNTARTDDGATPLYIASQNGHVDVARLLLGRNADPNTARTDDGATPLYIASQKATWR